MIADQDDAMSTAVNGKCRDMAVGGERSTTKLKDIPHMPKMNTPIPGSYHIRDFIEENSLNPVPKTFGFKGTGRSAQILCSRNGAVLLPGAYVFTDSVQDVLQHRASYSFKNCPRPDNYTLGIRDKDVNLSPCHYNVTEKPVPKLPCKHVMFRSAVQRLTFLPKEGPPPGHYTLKPSLSNGITSCFRSTVPRLHSLRSRTPGPGTYEPSIQSGTRLDTEANMGRAHGLFFRSVF